MRCVRSSPLNKVCRLKASLTTYPTYASGKQQRRGLGRNGFQLLNQSCAIELGHHQVGEYQIDAAALHGFDGAFGIGTREHANSRVSEVGLCERRESVRRRRRRESYVSVSFTPTEACSGALRSRVRANLGKPIREVAQLMLANQRFHFVDESSTVQMLNVEYQLF